MRKAWRWWWLGLCRWRGVRGERCVLAEGHRLLNRYPFHVPEEEAS